MGTQRAYYCEKCKKMLPADHFYTSQNLEKYPNDGKMTVCKDCLTMHVDNWNPDTFIPILEELDLPYVRDTWNNLLEKLKGQDPRNINGKSVLGRYISTMKLNQYKSKHFADTDALNAANDEKKRNSMRMSGFTTEKIEEELEKARKGPDRIVVPFDSNQYAEDNAAYTPASDQVMDQLTNADKLYLRVKWGEGYTGSEWVKMEQLYNDMMESYDVQGAGAKDTLILICKASLIANQMIDSKDLAGFAQATKVYNDLMKANKMTAAQVKKDDEDVMDSFAELFVLAEEKGFVPNFYNGQPNDRVDETIRDTQHYLRQLVMDELNLGQMIENALNKIKRDQENESRVDLDDADALFAEVEASPVDELSPEDYEAFAEMQQRLNGEEEE